MKDIENRVSDVIAVQLGLPITNLKPQDRIVEDLGGDSLDLVEIVIALEDEFEINIPDDEADRLTTVQQTIDYVKQRVEQEA